MTTAATIAARLQLDSKDFNDGLDNALKKTGQFAEDAGAKILTIGAVGAAAFAALAVAAVAAGVAVTEKILSIADSTGEMAHNMELLSAKTGLSTQALQQWAYAGKFVGLTADDISTYFYRLSKNAYSAEQSKNGPNAAMKAFNALGVSIYGTSGKLKDTNQLFLESIAAIGKVSDPTLQDALAMQIFGRSAQDLMPLVAAGSDQLEGLFNAANDVGAVLSDADMQAFAKYKANLMTMQSSVSGLSSTFVGQFMPALNFVTDGIINVLKDIHSGDLGAAADDISKLWSQMSDSVVAAIPGIQKNITGFMTWFTTVLKAKLPDFIKSGKNILIAVWNGIAGMLPTLFDSSNQIGSTIITALEDALPDIYVAGMNLLGALGDAINRGWNNLKPGLPTVADIISWIFKTASDLSAAFLSWVSGVRWGDLARDIATAISNLPWTTYGEEFGKMAKNFMAAIQLFLFGGTVQVQSEDTGKWSTRVVQGVDWGAVGLAVAKALGYGIVGALGTEGLGLGDVSNWPDLNDEWANIGTEYGAVVGRGAGKAFWKEYWIEVGHYLLESDLMNFLLNGFTDPTTGKSAVSAALYTWEMQQLIPGLEKTLESGILGPTVQLFATLLFDPGQFQEAWNKFSAWVISSWTWLMKSLALVPVPSIFPNTGTTPTTVVGGASNPGFKTPQNGNYTPPTTSKNVTINIHNPVPEPASASISQLTRMAYTGQIE
jgi:hypothetical protein